MTRATTYLLIITLNGNGLNSPIKRHRLVWILKNRHKSFVAYKKSTSLAKTNTGLK
jgi:hypothetical protein